MKNRENRAVFEKGMALGKPSLTSVKTGNK
jgi:hypothetical protein